MRDDAAAEEDGVLFSDRGTATDALKARNAGNRLAAAEMALVGEFATEGADDDDFAALEAATAAAASGVSPTRAARAAPAAPAAPVAAAAAAPAAPVGALDDDLFGMLGGAAGGAAGEAPSDDFDFDAYVSKNADGGGGLFD